MLVRNWFVARFFVWVIFLSVKYCLKYDKDELIWCNKELCKWISCKNKFKKKLNLLKIYQTIKSVLICHEITKGKLDFRLVCELLIQFYYYTTFFSISWVLNLKTITQLLILSMTNVILITGWQIRTHTNVI